MASSSHAAGAARVSVLTLQRDDVEDLSRSRREPAWLRDRRLAFFERWERVPMPSRTDEAWRRTDLSRVAFDAYEVAREGRVELSGPTEELREKGVVFADLATALREHESLLRDHLFADLAPEDGKFAALHGALAGAGAVVYVPAGVVVERPLRVVSTHAADGAALFPHTLVVAERGSRVLLVEEGASAGDTQGFTAAATQVVVREGAQVLHALVNGYGPGMVHFLSHRARLDRDARYQGLFVALGSRLTKASIATLLAAPGADSQILGVVFGQGAQHFDHDTLQDHRAPHTTSRLLFKTALKDRSRSVYTGLLRMSRTALQADASQTNRNLLLSRQAKADSIPKLEIEVNDVRCSHAAATSPIEEDPVFYLMSRGLTRDEAVQMIVEGFLDEVLALFPLPELRERVVAELGRRLGVGGL